MRDTQLTFTTICAPGWDEKIIDGLRKECKALIGIFEEFKPHALYAMVENKFAGGVVFEQHANILWIDAIWVEVNFRKQGVGKQLMEKANQFAIQNNLTEIQLNTYFKDSHDFFLFCEFKDTAIIPNWKYGLDCYLMQRTV
jgi:GNAT superfamily N-acetyltransferase